MRTRRKTLMSAVALAAIALAGAACTGGKTEELLRLRRGADRPGRR